MRSITFEQNFFVCGCIFFGSFFEETGLEIISSGFDRIPTVTKSLTEEQQADIDKLLEKIEEDEDVQNVFTNVAN